MSQNTTTAGSFSELGLSAALTSTVQKLGYETPTPIQQQTIPLLLSGRDLIGQAQTGTGKTAAFALPILDMLDLRSNALQALVLTPTRELAIQVSEAIHTYSKGIGRIRTMPVYGGESIHKQINRLRGGIHVVVGTPGRMIDHLDRGTISLDNIEMVVLDEADEMLRMGFIKDVEKILSRSPENRQTALFSATMPREVKRIADRFLNNPVLVEVERKASTQPPVEQQCFMLPQDHKLDALGQLLETEIAVGESVIIFVRTKIGAAKVAKKLKMRGHEAEALHGDMTQPQRERVLRRMRAGQVNIVVATDVAARGLDVEQIGMVINYDMPGDAEAYVHRIGRTGRAGRSGRAILFATAQDLKMVREIENFTGQRLTPKKFALDPELIASIRAAQEARAAAGPQEDDSEDGDGRRIDADMVRLLINTGRRAKVSTGDLLSFVASESGVSGKSIGMIDIHEDFSVIEVPRQLQRQMLSRLDGAAMRGREVEVRAVTPQDVIPVRQRVGTPNGNRGRSGGGNGRSGQRSYNSSRA